MIKRKYSLKRTGIKRVPLKRKSFSDEEYKEYEELRDEIWRERSHNCQVCNKWLGKDHKSFMFDHLLEKSARPDLFLVKDNIALVCLECHTLKTNGFPKERHLDFIKGVSDL